MLFLVSLIVPVGGAVLLGLLCLVGRSWALEYRKYVCTNLSWCDRMKFLKIWPHLVAVTQCNSWSQWVVLFLVSLLVPVGGAVLSVSHCPSGWCCSSRPSSVPPWSVLNLVPVGNVHCSARSEVHHLSVVLCFSVIHSSALHWGTVGAEIKVPSVESPELSKVLPLKKPGVGLPPTHPQHTHTQQQQHTTTNKQQTCMGSSSMITLI